MVDPDTFYFIVIVYKKTCILGFQTCLHQKKVGEDIRHIKREKESVCLKGVSAHSYLITINEFFFPYCAFFLQRAL